MTRYDYTIYDYVFGMLLKVAFEATFKSRFKGDYIILEDIDL